MNRHGRLFEKENSNAAVSERSAKARWMRAGRSKRSAKACWSKAGRLLVACVLAVSGLLGPAAALAEDGGGEGGETKSPQVVSLELFQYGTWNTSGVIEDAGTSVDLYIQLLFDNSDYLSWAQWSERAGSYTGSYYAVSSDESVAKVSTQNPLYGQMTVTAAGEGTAQITVYYTPYGDDGSNRIESSAFTVTVPHQDPVYVTGVTILNEDGSAVGDDPVVFYETGAYMQFYVAVDWYNSSTGESWTERTEDGSFTFDYITWESDAEDLVYVNPQTGRIMVKSGSKTNSARIYAKTSRGKGASEVSDSIYVSYDGQDARSYKPAENLTLSVEYEKMPEGYEPKKYVFTIDEVVQKCGGLQYQAYTYFRQNGSYSTHFVQGVKLYEVIKMVQTDIDEIQSFRFSSQINDGYEVPISHDMMYNTTHYFCTEPEVAYSYSGSQWRQYATATTPLLATSAYTSQGPDFNKYISGGSIDWESVPLDSAQVFRLEIGCTDPSDIRAQSKSVYNVDTITIVLKGAPPGTNGDDPGGNGDNGGGKGGNGTGDGSGGSEVGTGGQTGQTGGSAQAGSGNENVEGSKRWQVYQMITKLDSITDPLPSDNPMEPYALPAAALVVIAGGTSMGIGFRRRMR